MRFGVPDMARRVQDSGRTGWYYRVLEPGFVAPGDALQLLERRSPDWTVDRLRRVLYVNPLDRQELSAMAALAHLPRYLKGVHMRLDKWRADPARDAQRLAELRPLEQRYLRALAERKGQPDARLDEFRWLLEELRVSLFAQELRTPQPVSVKRLEKAWDQLQR